MPRRPTATSTHRSSWTNKGERSERLGGAKARQGRSGGSQSPPQGGSDDPAARAAVPGAVAPTLTGGMAARKYVIRTFGCQMNEHDSERIAGLLEADGLEAAADVDDADVIVLNTCCIRENADNKLYGNLGHLKSVKDARPGMQIVVAGCQIGRASCRDRG